MASMTMMTSLCGSASSVKQSPAAACRRLVIASSSRGVTEGEKVKLNVEAKKECSDGRRRDLMFAAAAAAVVCSVAGLAVAEEPKAGTPEAKKFYAPVCVTMPTAKVCHK